MAGVAEVEHRRQLAGQVELGFVARLAVLVAAAVEVEPSYQREAGQRCC